MRADRLDPELTAQLRVVRIRSEPRPRALSLLAIPRDADTLTIHRSGQWPKGHLTTHVVCPSSESRARPQPVGLPERAKVKSRHLAQRARLDHAAREQLVAPAGERGDRARTRRFHLSRDSGRHRVLLVARSTRPPAHVPSQSRWTPCLGRLDLLAVVSTLVSRVAVRLAGCGITLAAPLCWLKRGG
jgi:hypothetical protein